MLGPGATVGILGGGQLGRMLTFEAHKMGYRTVVMDTAPDCPAGLVADGYVQGAFGDRKAALELAAQSDVVTVETEHIPWELLADVEATGKTLRPTSSVLRTIQNRLRQKEFLAAHGFPQPAFRHVTDEASLLAGVAAIGAPAVLKTLTGGYDGKGQARIMAPDEAVAAWESVGRAPCILEAFVSFRIEVSVVFARGLDGETRAWPLAENVHRKGVLHTTVSPARVAPGVEARAQKLAQSIAEALAHVGVMAVEMFLLPDDTLLVNEIAPRVHNSGHHTFGASVTSQFEQHLRAILGLPLGDTALLTPAAMLNVLGDAWKHGEPDWAAALAEPTAKLHLYGKKKASPGRKMAHVTILGPDADAALATAERIHAGLAR